MPVDEKMTAPRVRDTKGIRRLSVVTAYDATFARLLDDADVDILLVGDSLGMVVQGLTNTLPVTVDDMVYHTRCVVRGTRRAQVVADMPFMSYQPGPRDALLAAADLVKRGGAEAVKLEGGEEIAATVERLVSAGIPVMGHVGLTPQSVHRFGGFRVQGRSAQARRGLLADGRALQEAGAYAVVVEGVPPDVAEELTTSLEIPTIGIGAGPACDGQVLVCYDLLGLFQDFKPKFVKHFDNLGPRVTAAARAFVDEVQAGSFPAAEHSFKPVGPARSPDAEPTGAGPLGKPGPAPYGPAEERE